MCVPRICNFVLTEKKLPSHNPLRPSISPRYDTTDVEPAPEPCATSEMCQFCFDIVISDLSSENTRFANDSVPLFMSALPPTIACPLFITWDKKKVDSSVEYVLRGCIGSLSPRPLATAVRDYALTSALRDNRFDPVRLEEVPNLRVGVSLLVKYEQCTHVYDWQVGIHGILIKFTENGFDYSATYLPEVAKEQQYVRLLFGY